MVTVLDECGAVLLALTEEVTPNLDELSQIVDLARSDAVGAFKAASLLYFNAELSESWTDKWSRPRAIFARHSEAVSDGATRIRPATPTSRINPAESFQRELSDAERSRSGGQFERPQCSATAKSTGRACSRSALALGPSEFLAHCYGHLEQEERAQYDSYQYQLADGSDRNAVRRPPNPQGCTRCFRSMGRAASSQVGMMKFCARRSTASSQRRVSWL